MYIYILQKTVCVSRLEYFQAVNLKDLRPLEATALQQMIRTLVFSKMYRYRLGFALILPVPVSVRFSTLAVKL